MLVTDLADVLRAAGVRVSEVPGWKIASHRPMLAVKGVICHHTAGPPRATGTPSLSVVIHGRPDVSGPLCNIYLAPDGTAYTVAAGRANHAGVGQFVGITDGGSNFLGIEAENAGDGRDPWLAVQMDAYVHICAALAKHYRFPAAMVIGHKEWAMPRGRKIDPSFDMGAFRTRVEGLIGGASPALAVQMVMLGSRGDVVTAVQRALNVWASARTPRPFPAIDTSGQFDAATDAALRIFQQAKGLAADGKAGPLTQGALK